MIVFDLQVQGYCLGLQFIQITVTYMDLNLQLMESDHVHIHSNQSMKAIHGYNGIYMNLK